jgi:hypothetical protein
MNIIFLDIDGVLNSWKDLEFELENNPDADIYINTIFERPTLLLKEIINKTDAKIVLSSSWRIVHFEKAITLLKKYGIRIYDRTPYLGTIRGKEIKTWLTDNDYVDSFVILDDDADMEDLIDNLIKTNNYYGLQEEHVEQAINMLNNNIKRYYR